MGSRPHVRDIKTGPPLPYQDDIRAHTREYAEALDAQDPLHQFRDEFIIPSKNDLKRKVLAEDKGVLRKSKCSPHCHSNDILTVDHQTVMKHPTQDASTCVVTLWVCSHKVPGGTLSNI